MDHEDFIELVAVILERCPPFIEVHRQITLLQRKVEEMKTRLDRIRENNLSAAHSLEMQLSCIQEAQEIYLGHGRYMRKALEERLPNVDVLVAYKPGGTIVDMERYLLRRAALDFPIPGVYAPCLQMCFILIGGNDICYHDGTMNSSALGPGCQKFLDRLHSLEVVAQNRLGAFVRISLVSPLPRWSPAFNDTVRRIERKMEKAAYADLKYVFVMRLFLHGKASQQIQYFENDRIHLNAFGKYLLAGRVAQKWLAHA